MASVPDSSLEAGLAALKQGEYLAAIATLEAVCQTNLNQAEQLKAQMGLVEAYIHTDAINRAIALCQTLSESNHPQVKNWAVKYHAELTNRYGTSDDVISPETDLTGFVPFAEIKTQESEAKIFDSSSPPATSAPLIPTFNWRQARRAKRWQPLSKINLVPLWLLQCGSAIALFWLIRELVKFAMAFTNDLLVKLPYLEPFQPFYHDPTQSLLLTLGILVILSPWLLDQLLQLFYGLQPLAFTKLATYSPETSRVLQRYCEQRGWHQPNLGILPTLAPVILTYGNLPRTARIIVSQGLLEQLADDEIATIYATQLGHIANKDFVLMSLFLLVSQLPYVVYWQVSQWGDRVSNQILQFTAATIASFAYGIWYLLSAPALWLSRLRIYYSDRHAAEITGNPNGLTRGLIKIAQGITKDIQQQGHTSWLLESWNLLIPIGYKQAIALGSGQSRTELEKVLVWDYLNPYRHWLNINNTHPLMGDRLQRLTQIANYWHLETELIISQKLESKIFNPSSPYSPTFLLQAAPFFGILLGFVFAGFTWFVGAIGIMLGNAQLASMYGDWVIVTGCLPIGFSIGTLIRINFLFPDIKSSTLQTNLSLPHLLANPNALPIDSQPICLQGKLLGRHGISNCLGQDLILRSPSGLVKLHYVSSLGAIGSLLLRHSPSPTDLLNRHLITTGWFRRGATTWIDVDILQTQGGKTTHSHHPGWSTLLASMATAWGVYIILHG